MGETVGYVFLGLCWGPSTLIGCYKCCKYAGSDQYISDHARKTVIKYYERDKFGRQIEITKVNDPAMTTQSAKFFGWSLGGPISILLFSIELYKKHNTKHKNNNTNDVVTEQPQASQMREENGKF